MTTVASPRKFSQSVSYVVHVRQLAEALGIELTPQQIVQIESAEQRDAAPLLGRVQITVTEAVK
jgi:hypothetical protein